MPSCDGASNAIVVNTQCTIPVSALRTAPFTLPWGSLIYVKVTAINIYGLSQASPIGSGAVIITKPDAPVLAENYGLRAAT